MVKSSGKGLVVVSVLILILFFSVSPVAVASVEELCVNGSPCVPANPCHDGQWTSCVPGPGECLDLGTNVADGTSCTDVNSCTSTDTCTAGTCGGIVNVCSNQGTCNPDNGFCDCNNPDFGGPNCDEFIGISCYGKPYIEPDVCSGQGSCDTQDLCSCNEGYDGDDCSVQITCNGVPATDPGVCSENGVCEFDEGLGNGICQCTEDWEGLECETYTGAPTTTTTSTTTQSPTTTQQGGANEIPEFPTAALPAFLAVGGYMAIRLFKKRR